MAMAVILAAWLLFLSLTAKGCLAVQSPTGLVVKQSLSLNGTEITFEWCSPLCPAEYNSSTWPGEAFVFRVNLFNATSDTVISSETLSEDGSNPVKLRCRDEGEGRLPLRRTFTGLEPHQEYYLEVQSSAFSGDDAGVYSESIRSISATASLTAKGSGREQYAKSGISSVFTDIPLDSDYHKLADWDESGRFAGWSTSAPAIMGYTVQKTVEHTLPLDFDGDGHTDLFVVGSKTNVLLVNNGSGYFFGVEGNFGIDGSEDKSKHAVMADFNGDGLPDIFVTNDGTANEILFNSNQGTDSEITFRSVKLDIELTFGDAYRNQSVSSVAGDFDGDGCIDIFVANYQQRNTLLVGDCQGGFTPAEAGQATEFETLSAEVVAFDADGDGDLDIFEACSTHFSALMPNYVEERANSLYFNDGNGDFTRVDISGSRDESTGVVAGDFNGDGAIDLFVVGKHASDSREYLINDGSGNFTSVVGDDATLKKSAAQQVTACDVDLDGDLDIIVTPGAIVLLNDGTGNFTYVDKGATTRWRVRGKHACFDADRLGGLDIWTAEGTAYPTLLLNRGGGTLEPHDGGDVTNERRANTHMEAFDANGDGYLDLYVTTLYGENKLLLNDGTGKFKSHSSKATERSGVSKHALAFDANGDGHPDLYVTNGFFSGQANQYRQYNELFLNDNQGKGNFVLVSKEDAGDVIGHDGPMSYSSAGLGDTVQSDYAMAFDCDNDGDLDLLLVRQHIHDPSGLFLNDGNGSFEYSQNAVQELKGNGDVGAYPKMAVALDVDNDGALDLFVVMFKAVNMVLLNNGQGIFTSVDGGDATGAFPQGGSCFSYVCTGAHQLWWSMAVVGDFNQDGFTDLYVPALHGLDRNLLLLNEGRSDGVSLIAADGGELGSMHFDGNPKAEDFYYATIDIDQDGDLDLIGVGYNVNSMSLYMNDGSAKFKRFVLDWDGQTQTGNQAIVGDFDGDGDPDIVFSTSESRFDELRLNCGTGYVMTPAGTCAPSASKPVITGILPPSSDTSGNLAIIQGSLGRDPAGSVHIGDRPCEISSYLSNNMWICTIPEFSLADGTNESIPSIRVENYGHISVAEDLFQYHGPLIESVDPKFIYGAGPVTFTVIGSNFGAALGDKIVTVGNYSCEVLSSVDQHSLHDAFKCVVSDPTMVSETTGLLPFTITVGDQDHQSDESICIETEEGSMKCKCDPGYAWEDGACVACPQNTFSSGSACEPCPLGASSSLYSTHLANCSCPTDSYFEALSNNYRCECFAGYEGDATIAGTGCSPCGADSFKPSKGNYQCTQCPTGSVIGGGMTNATSSSDCECGLHADFSAKTGRCECLAGYGGDATVAGVGCSACGSGAYKENKGNTQCTSCPMGSAIANNVQNATNGSDCVCSLNAEKNDGSGVCECLAGFGGDATLTNVGCSPCGSTSFKETPGNDQCTFCPPGSRILESDGSPSTNSSLCACVLFSEMNTDNGRCECNAGYGGDATVASAGCLPCGNNAFKEMPGNYQCTPCPVGSFVANGTTAMHVEECACGAGTVTVGDANSSYSCQCAIGYYGSSADRSCRLCSVGEFKDKVGDAASCKPCALEVGEGGTTLQQGSTSINDCVCGNGYYLQGGACVQCEVGAFCPGGDVSSMVALPGYWRSDPESTTFFSCETPNGNNICMGGDPWGNNTVDGSSGSFCREGHKGLLCSKCEKGYGKTYGVCTKCDPSNWSSIVLVMFALVAFLVVLFGLISKNLKRATAVYDSKGDDLIAMSVLKIIINWLQMASIAAQVRVQSNEPTEKFFQVQDVSNMSPWQFSSFNCMIQSDYYTKFYLSLCIPPVCLVLSLGFSCLYFLIKKNRKDVWIGDLFIMISQLLWFFTYSVVSQTILEVFGCRSLDRGVSVLSSDLSIQCNTAKHDSAVKIGFTFVALYVIGIPLQVFAQLYWYKDKLEEKSVKVRYMFLFHNYRKGLHWYECMNMLRKMVLVTALVLLQEDLGTQVFALSVISMTYLTIHAYIKPYSSKTLNELETGALFLTALTLSMCSFFYANPGGSGSSDPMEWLLTWCVIVLSAVLLLFSLFLVAKDGLFAIAHGNEKSGTFDLPSRVSKNWSKEAGRFHDLGSANESPSQFKSLLANDEQVIQSPLVSTPRSDATHNPLQNQEEPMTGSNDVDAAVNSSGVPHKSKSQIVRNPVGNRGTPSKSSETDSSERGNLPDSLVRKMESKAKKATSIVRNPLA